MNRFWTSVINPVLDAVSPHVVVQIGAGDGGLSRDLLAYCRLHGSRLHVIDPRPVAIDGVADADHGGALVVHRARSLDVLPSLPTVDVAIIDGGHNSYNVYHELVALDGIRSRTGHPPTILLPETGSPAGMRDSYDDPAALPADFVHGPVEGGLVPGELDPMPVGIRAHTHHADREGGARNGVRASIEDFRRDSERAWRFVDIPGFHGLGVLVPPGLVRSNEGVQAMLTEFGSPRWLRHHCAAVDAVRIEQMLSAEAAEQRVFELTTDVGELERRNADVVRAVEVATQRQGMLTAQLDQSSAEVERLRAALESADRERRRLRTSASEAEEALAAVEEVRVRVDAELGREQGRREEAEDAVARVGEELAAAHELRAQLEARLAEVQAQLASEDGVRRRLEQELAATQAESARLAAALQAAEDRVDDEGGRRAIAEGLAEDLESVMDERLATAREDERLRAQSELQRVGAEFAEARRALVTARDERDERAAQAEALRGEVQSLRERADGAEQKRAAAEELVGRLQAEIALERTARSESAEERDKLVARLDEAVAARDRASDELAQVRAALDAMRAGRDALTAQLDRTAAVLTERDQRVAVLENERGVVLQQLLLAEQSQAWRWGHRIVRILRVLTLRRPGRTDALSRAVAQLERQPAAGALGEPSGNGASGATAPALPSANGSAGSQGSQLGARAHDAG